MPVIKQAWSLFCTARAMSSTYKKHHQLSSKYVYATSRGHEVVQIALGLHCEAQDYLFPYYRDDALLLAAGLKPKDLMAQLLSKAADPFSMGRNYYAHASLKDEQYPQIPHQSSGTGMQAIPAVGAALGLQYLEKQGLSADNQAIVVCSLGDGALSEGEVAEALQFSELKQLPILFLVQNNRWSLSAKAEEIRGSKIKDFLAGFPNIRYYSIDGKDFRQCYDTFGKAIHSIRSTREPVFIEANVTLLGDHTSSVPAKRYRDDLQQNIEDPFELLQSELVQLGEAQESLDKTYQQRLVDIEKVFLSVVESSEPDVANIEQHIFAEKQPEASNTIAITAPANKQFMLEYGLLALRDLLTANPECLVFGQDVGGRLGGVFGVTAALEQEFGSHRVFNMPIQEALTVGSTVGLSAVGCRPIVEIQFADYLWLGLNQLFSELSRSCYLTAGKWPVNAVIRVAIGAYNCHGPYHSSSIEAILTNIVGIKVVYPSCGVDLYGLLQAAYHDPNPVIVLEHKALYWASDREFELLAGSNNQADGLIAIGKSKLIQTADLVSEKVCIVTWGMGVHLARKAAKQFDGQIEIVDLRTLSPIDEEGVYSSVRKCERCIVLTEEAKNHSFAQSLAGKIQENCFADLVSGIKVLGALDIPAIPLNEQLEQAALPDVNDIVTAINSMLKK